MATWFQAKIKFVQEDEKGVARNVGQVYLFDAVSYTDAEARAYQHLAAEVPDFQLTGLTKMKLNEVYFEENSSEIWFKCKVSYIVFDEKSQREKKVPYTFLLNAHTIKDAYIILESKLGTVQDYIITDIGATKILDVIPYEEDTELEEPQPVITEKMKPLAEVLKAFDAEE
ncbi:MAG: DUF4494 domain-containing protein [Leadbetterella sp.]|nr:DUF4494 domain-containing protein [Leadbetterella sp.]